MRRPFRLISDPVLPGYRKDGSLKDKIGVFYKKNTRLVILSILTFLILILWWSTSPPKNSMVLESVYSVVFDAGSTGSRVHVYRFDIGQNETLILKGDDFNRLKPGISSYAEDPDQAGASLDPLLTAINGVVPASKMAQTPCQLRATAGLRMLPDSQSQAILDSVRKRIDRTGYDVGDDAVSILDGNYEGAYAWLTVNYLLEKYTWPNT